MGKRSGFARRPNDYYVTPWEAVRPLLPHLPHRVSFVEPCAGNGALVDHLESVGHHCVGKVDIAPQREDIRRASAFTIRWRNPAGLFITNPPWTRAVMHPLLRHLCLQTPTWALFDSDWAYNAQANVLSPYLRRIVAVGRVKWEPESDSTGKDNAAWYLFDGTRPPTQPLFFTRPE